MWNETSVTSKLNCDYPIIQAGMAGGTTTPELVAAVSNAGGVGTLGAGYMSGADIQTAIRKIRELTDRPFAVNLFIPEQPDEDQKKIATMIGKLENYREALGCDVIDPKIFAPSFEEQIATVIEERVPIFSFTFGLLDNRWLQELKTNNIITIGTATTVDEAKQLERSGVDIVVAQGSEAGGHRGTFHKDFQDSMISTFALIPQVVDQVTIPVIASGGIMDERGVLAAVALGADGVQMGTAFLTCRESGAHAKHKEAVLESNDVSTTVTTAFSGKPARGIKNLFIEEVGTWTDVIPDYPIQNAITQPLRKQAAKQNKPEYMSLWAGQAGALATGEPAEVLIQSLVTGVDRLRSGL